jgi:hypothetical protein
MLALELARLHDCQDAFYEAAAFPFTLHGGLNGRDWLGQQLTKGFATNSPIGRGSRQLTLLWREGWRVANPCPPSDCVQHAGLPANWRGGARAGPRRKSVAKPLTKAGLRYVVSKTGRSKVAVLLAARQADTANLLKAA